MNISREDLDAREFRRAGTVYPDASSILRVEMENGWDVPGWVTYIMVVDGEFKKAGKTGDGESTLKGRMSSTFQALRQVIAGPPANRPPARWRSRPLDPFKQNGPAAILAQQQIELWAKRQPTRERTISEETELNEHYRGEWTKEGWTKDGRRR
jgi:hypothetical protein